MATCWSRHQILSPPGHFQNPSTPGTSLCFQFFYFLLHLTALPRPGSIYGFAALFFLHVQGQAINCLKMIQSEQDAEKLPTQLSKGFVMLCLGTHFFRLRYMCEILIFSIAGVGKLYLHLGKLWSPTTYLYNTCRKLSANSFHLKQTVRVHLCLPVD